MPGIGTKWMVLLATLITLTTVYGGFHFYSPVPYWDQWGGQIGFYQRFADHPFAELWAQHNEHRIVFSKLLFLIDRALFNGNNAWLIVVNYLLVAGTAAAFIIEYLRQAHSRLPKAFILALIVGGLMLWTQKDNFTWGFQSGSLGVNFFIVWAFACFAQGRLISPILLVIAATLTMGNGIVGFGGLALMALIQRRNWPCFLMIVIVGSLVVGAYFYGYTTPPRWFADPDVAQKAQAHPIFFVLRFFFIFLGNPIHSVISDRWVAAAWGLISFVGFSMTSLHVILKNKVTPYRAFLIATLTFIVISAIGTTHARWQWGLPVAATSRYTTPALVYLVAGLLLGLDVAKERTARTLALITLVLLTLLATCQRTVFYSNTEFSSRKLAILDQQLGFGWPAYKNMLHPGDLHDMLNYAATHKISVYDNEWLQIAGQQVDHSKLITGCHGRIETTAITTGKQLIQGWISSRSNKDQLIAIVDGTGKTIGWGVTEVTRSDFRSWIPGILRKTKWTALAEVSKDPLNAYVYSAGHWCRFFQR